jgi:hypothetical protein
MSEVQVPTPLVRHRRTFAVLVVALAAVATAVAIPSSARLVPAEPLGAVTTVQTSTSGTAELVLYDDATLSPALRHNPDITVSGKGRLVGFTMSRTDGGGDGVSAVRLPSFAGGAVQVTGSYIPEMTCTNYPNDTIGIQARCGDCTYTAMDVLKALPKCDYHPTAIKLHEGYYHLVVVTDGAPIRVTFRLHGESRKRSSLHLQRIIRTAEVNLPQQESIGSSTVTFGGGATAGGATELTTVVAARLHQSAAFLAATACTRHDTGAPPPYAYSPACPNGQTDGYAYQIGAPAPVNPIGGFGAFAYVSSHPTKVSGVGGSFVDSDGPKYLGGLALSSWGESIPFWGWYEILPA